MIQWVPDVAREVKPWTEWGARSVHAYIVEGLTVNSMSGHKAQLQW